MEGEHVMGTVKEDLEKELFIKYREYMDVHSWKNKNRSETRNETAQLRKDGKRLSWTNRT